MDIVPVDEVYQVVRRGKAPSPDLLLLPALWIRLFDLTCPDTQANIVQCLQEEQLESITFAQFRDWAHGPEGEQKDEGCVLSWAELFNSCGGAMPAPLHTLKYKIVPVMKPSLAERTETRPS